MNPSTFRPTRAEVRRVRNLALDCEIHAAAALRLGAAGHPNPYGHDAARYSRQAFRLAEAVARRGGAA